VRGLGRAGVFEWATGTLPMGSLWALGGRTAVAHGKQGAAGVEEGGSSGVRGSGVCGKGKRREIGGA
jgi:hypothetical protein